MPETNETRNTISNPAKVLLAYMRLANKWDSRELAAEFDVPLRTIQRWKMECAANVTDATGAIYGVTSDNGHSATRATNATDGAPLTPDMALARDLQSCAGATKESPTEIVITNQLASLPADDISEAMITDIIAWMHGGDRRSAESWLASTTKTFGSDATREGYHKLKTDMATGSVVSRKLQAWSEIARRFKAKPAATANVVSFRPTDTSGRPLPTMSEVLARIAAEDAAHAAG